MREQRDELFAQGDVGLVREHVEARVNVLGGLLLNRAHDRRGAVPGIDDTDAAREVDQLAPFDVIDARTFGARNG